MCYTMLYMLEWMRKKKHKIRTPWTRELRGSALSAYIHEGILKGYIFIYIYIYKTEVFGASTNFHVRMELLQTSPFDKTKPNTSPFDITHQTQNIYTLSNTDPSYFAESLQGHDHGSQRFQSPTQPPYQSILSWYLSINLWIIPFPIVFN